MEALDFVAVLFNVTLTQVSRGMFSVSRKIELDEFKQAVSECKLQWQDLKAIDCGNGNGFVYFMLGDDNDALLAYDAEEDMLYLS